MLDNEIAESRAADETATKVLAVCRKLLKNDKFGLDDNFFDSGGHSLLAMVLALELENELRLSIGPEKIFGRPTVRELCASLKGDVGDGPVALLTLTRHPVRHTIYFIHAAFEFSSLCEGLSPDVAAAFVTVHDRKWLQRLMANAGILEVLDRISDAYADAILSTHKGGALCLAGHSSGGIFAIETAGKLEQRGVKSDYIFLFDTYVHSPAHRVLYDLSHHGSASQKVRNLLRACWSGGFALIGNKSARFTPVDQASDNSDAQFGALLSQIRERTSAAYRGPERAPACRTVLFQATKTAEGHIRRVDPDPGWARVLKPNLSVMAMASDHFNMVKGQGAKRLAEEIKRFTRLPTNHTSPSRHQS